jgi:hypothetical protein
MEPTFSIARLIKVCSRYNTQAIGTPTNIGIKCEALNTSIVDLCTRIPELDTHDSRIVTNCDLFLSTDLCLTFDTFVYNVSHKAQSMNPDMTIDDLELCSNCIELYLDKYYSQDEIAISLRTMKEVIDASHSLDRIESKIESMFSMLNSTISKMEHTLDKTIARTDHITDTLDKTIACSDHMNDTLDVMIKGIHK